MKKVGTIIIIISIAMILFYLMYMYMENKHIKEDANNYIEQTSIIDNNNEETNDEKIDIKEEKPITINYTAVLEIPSIKLKQGVVDSTKNFNSINYAVSVDRNSNYPNVMGNFILYAHSGNSKIAFFNKLHKLNKNDDIYVFYNGVKYQYKVSNKYNIEKTGSAEVIVTNKDKYITLITCNQQEKGKQIVVIGKIYSESIY